MKLFYVPTSPYVRKVVVTAMETGLESRIERVVPSLFPSLSPELKAANPLGKVPALITDAGEALFDSPVICEYLDSLHGGQPLIPREGAARWRVLRWQALGDGILDAALLVRYERLRPKALQSAEWSERQSLKVSAGIATLEAEVGALKSAPFSVGQIAIGCALGYVDFRLPDFNWRESSPALAAWYAIFAERPSMTATAPREAK